MRAYALAACLICTPLLRAGQADLKALYDAHRWFALQDALSSAAPALYRGAVAAAFNRLREAESTLQPVLATGSDSEANDAAKWLNYLYLRKGLYQKAAAQMGGDSALAQMIRSLPNQSTARFAPSTVSCGMFRRKLYVAASIEAQPVEFFVDSDANFSFMSESEARNLGLAVRDSAVTVHGATGRETAFRVAVAERLQIGNVEIRNVAFLVLGDSEEIFRNISPAQQGAFGIPVLLALRTMRFGRQTTFDIGFPNTDAKSAPPNLCFDGVDPVTSVQFRQQHLAVVLDTGAEASEIWPPFARQFPEIVSAGASSSKVENSVGGKSRVPELVLPDLTLRAGGFDTHLRPAHILLAETTPDSRWYYGRLGLDVLNLAQQVTIDFDSLTLRLDCDKPQ